MIVFCDGTVVRQSGLLRSGLKTFPYDRLIQLSSTIWWVLAHETFH